MDLDDLRKKIMQDINEAQMPIDIIYYLMRDLEREVAQAYEQYLATKYNSQKTKEENKEEGEKE